MTELANDICRIVEETLKSTAKVGELKSPIRPDSSMEDIPEWDSLSFVSVFLAIGEHYDLDLEDDDAIHFTSIGGICEFVSGLI